ncbi:MAG TPA: S8 family serine peptidase [Kiloniellales bacterium]|nr:S8 family serine peptidase [Kiloniellales bacterium]
MRRFLQGRRLAVVLAVVAAIPLVGLATSSAARADWVILEYDESGRIVGVKRGGEESGPGGLAPAQRTPAPAAPGDPAAPSFAPRFVPDELIVIDPPEGFGETVTGLGFTVIERAVLGGLSTVVVHLKIPPRASVPESLRRLRGRFPGLVIDANHIIEPARGGPTPDAIAGLMLGWPHADADCGRDLRLGMIDGALDLSHPALTRQRIDYRSFHGPEHAPGAVDHGTAVAAMLVGAGIWGGLLPGAELVAANIFELDQAGRTKANTMGLIRALDWMLERRVPLINLSVAGPANATLERIFTLAAAKGPVMVAAVGNWGRSDTPAFPAAYPSVVAVTAVAADHSLYPHANRGDYVDFAAPGVDIQTAVPGGGRLQSGTSFAAPFVSVLLLRQIADQGAGTAEDLRRVLSARTRDLGEPGRDAAFGWGLVELPRRCAPRTG